MFPTLSKTYNIRFDIINHLGDSTSFFRRLLLQVVSNYTTMGANPWVVQYSSNSVTAGTPGDLTNRWLTESDLVFDASDTGNRSWIVLRNAVGRELLIELRTNGSNLSTSRFWVSFSAGFTGGGLTSRPTATDEVQVNQGLSGGGGNSNLWSGNTNTVSSARDLVLWTHLSDDGEVTRQWHFYDGVCTAQWGLEELDAPTAGASSSMFAAVSSMSSPTSTAINLISGYNTQFVGYERSTTTVADWTRVSLTSPGFTGNAGSLINENDGDRRSGGGTGPGNPFLLEIGVWGQEMDEIGPRGRRFDIWWVSLPATELDTFPNDGSRQLVRIGAFAVPHDGSIPNTFA